MISKIFIKNHLSADEQDNIIQILNSNGIAVIPTDTIYGIVCSALNQSSVEKIYHLKKRSPQKPPIILISSLDELDKFKIFLNQNQINLLSKLWPNPLSIILPCPQKELYYLHRRTNSLAFRIPNDHFLQNLLQQTGPLIAPSANFENDPPAEDIQKAQEYFKDQVDFYLDGGTLKSLPSTLIEIKDNNINILRQGVFKLPSNIIQKSYNNLYAK